MQFLQLSNIPEEGIGVMWIVPQLNEHLDHNLYIAVKEIFLNIKHH